MLVLGYDSREQFALWHDGQLVGKIRLEPRGKGWRVLFIDFPDEVKIGRERLETDLPRTPQAG